jgi:hypothetical protein
MTGMHKTNIHNKNKLIVASIAIVVALALFASPIFAMEDAFATKKKGNNTSQSISQSEASFQNSQIVYGGDTYDKTFVVLEIYPR